MSAKLYARGAAPEPGVMVATFHRWIVAQSFAGHTWLDVADYNHVKGGPGVMLIGIEADVSIDMADGAWGVVYTRKQAWSGSPDLTARLRATMREAVRCAAMLAADPALAGRMDFATDRIRVRLNDRLAAPNNEETLGRMQPALLEAGERVWGDGVTIEHHPSPGALFEAVVIGGRAIAIEAMQRQLEG